MIPGIPEGKVGTPLFFGAFEVAGHYTWQPSPTSDWPVHAWGYNEGWANWLRYQDGHLAPMPERPGHAALHRIDGRVTVLAWWDNAGDSRPGSNSMLLCDGKHTMGVMLGTLEALFPLVMKGQLAPILAKVPV